MSEHLVMRSRHASRPRYDSILSVASTKADRYLTITYDSVVIEEDEYEREESASEYRKRWTSLIIAFVLVFLMCVQNTIYWTSLWPFLDEVDPSAGENFYGYVIMIYGLGSAAACPLFGWWVNRSHQTRWPIIIGVFITIVGNIVLGFVEAFSANRKWVMFVARMITGFGTGNTGALYAYIVMASTESERNLAISIRAAVYSFSQMIGPGLQAAFVPLGYPGIVVGPFTFNMYTAPAYISAVLGVVQIGLLIFLFQESWISVAEVSTENGEKKSPDLAGYDVVAVAVCTILRFTVAFCWAYDDVVQSPFSIAMFGWSNSDAVLYNGILIGGLAVVGLAGNLFMGTYVLNYVKERVTIMIGLFLYFIGFLIILSWPGLPPMVPESGDLTAGSFANGTQVSQPNVTCIYVWCPYTTRVNLTQYIVCNVFVILAVVMAFVPTGTLFSKVLGPRRQGTMQGIFSASHQAANGLSPVIVGNLFEFTGPNVLWGVGLAIILASIVLTAAAFKRLVPWAEGKDGPKDERMPLLSDGYQSSYLLD